MVAEYSVTLENKTKSELILFIKQLQDMLKEKDKKIEYYKKQKDYDMQFRHELLEQIRCLNLDKDHNSAEIEQKNTELAEKSAEIEKKDKEIDLILDKLNENYTDVFKNNEVKGIIEIYEKIKNTSNLSGIKLRKECIKQYFERKVKK